MRSRESTESIVLQFPQLSSYTARRGGLTEESMIGERRMRNEREFRKCVSDVTISRAKSEVRWNQEGMLR